LIAPHGMTLRFLGDPTHYRENVQLISRGLWDIKRSVRWFGCTNYERFIVDSPKIKLDLEKALSTSDKVILELGCGPNKTEGRI